MVKIGESVRKVHSDQMVKVCQTLSENSFGVPMHAGDCPVNVVPIPEVEVDRTSVPELVSISSRPKESSPMKCAEKVNSPAKVEPIVRRSSRVIKTVKRLICE